MIFISLKNFNIDLSLLSNTYPIPCSLTRRAISLSGFPIKKIGFPAAKILYVLEWIKSSDILSLKDFLYRDSSVHLNRKYDLFQSFAPVEKVSKNPSCSLCSKHLRKDGKRYQNNKTYQRFYCISCKHSSQFLIEPGSNKIG